MDRTPRWGILRNSAGSGPPGGPGGAAYEGGGAVALPGQAEGLFPLFRKELPFPEHHFETGLQGPAEGPGHLLEGDCPFRRQAHPGALRGGGVLHQGDRAVVEELSLGSPLGRACQLPALPYKVQVTALLEAPGSGLLLVGEENLLFPQVHPFGPQGLDRVDQGLVQSTVGLFDGAGKAGLGKDQPPGEFPDVVDGEPAGDPADQAGVGRQRLDFGGVLEITQGDRGRLPGIEPEGGRRLRVQEEGLLEGCWDDECLRVISGETSIEAFSDVRIAIEALSIVASLAEKENLKKITPKLCARAFWKARRHVWRFVVSRLNAHQLAILLAVARLKDEDKTSAKVYESYKRICGSRGISP